MSATSMSTHAGSSYPATANATLTKDWFIGLGMLFFALVWLTQLAATSLTAPADNIEQLTWVRSLQWGYYKHPPFPTWLLWAPVKLLGWSVWTSYVVGATCTLGSIALLWRLLVRLRGEAYACVGLLAILCITYYNGRLNYYNHNVVLLLLNTLSATLCWQAFSTRRLRWWIALGLTLGLGALSKYQIAVTMISVAVFAVQQRAWRTPRHRLGLLLSGLITLLVFVPHLEWLRTHDFGPIQYAVESSLGLHVDMSQRLFGLLHWQADQVFTRALPGGLLLLAVCMTRDASSRQTADNRPMENITNNDPFRSFLLTWGLVPLVFIPLVGLLFGAELQLQWGTAFLLFAVPAAMELAPTDIWHRVNLPRVFLIFIIIQTLLLTLNYATSPRGVPQLGDHHWRTFDSKALARNIAAPARVELGSQICFVKGPAAISGAVALALTEQPLVLIDGRFDRSPWIKPELMQTCGGVEIGSVKSLPEGIPLGPNFQDLSWRIVKPAIGSSSRINFRLSQD